ncbi:hypothetical protein [Saccharopolyspora griseoalba]|uniref:Uncharacterized protein n=1 Tax=Saccharopolyspora griseoalba TaxID=1431848 RepID=A0ABW2LTK7_9PSEU
MREPPVPVVVDLRYALPPQRIGVQPGTPLIVRSGGIDNGRTVNAELVAWHLTATGDRWAHVREVELVSRNGRGRMMTEMWVPEVAVRPRSGTPEG